MYVRVHIVDADVYMTSFRLLYLPRERLNLSARPTRGVPGRDRRSDHGTRVTARMWHEQGDYDVGGIKNKV